MLQQADLRAGLDAVHAIASAGASLDGFLRAGVASLPRLIASDLTRACTARVSDLAADRDLRCSPICDEYYRAVGIDYVMALPVHVEGRELVSFVFNRRHRDFTERDRACAEAIRPLLGDLYRMALALDSARAAWGVPSAADRGPQGAPLTEREREVLRCLAGGKTDKDIGAILGISPRTVHKHLQRIYDKLGVETRTAAVARFLQKNP